MRRMARNCAYIHPAIELGHKLTQVINSSLAPSTKQLYSRAWALLHDFGRKCNISVFPSDRTVLGLWITDLHIKGYATNTIRTFVSAISYYHKLSSYPDPSAYFMVEQTFQGLKRIRPSVDVRKPITQAILHQLVCALHHSNLTNYNTVLYTSMFLLAFYGLCRVCELTYSKHNRHNLQLLDIQVCTQLPHLIVTFRSFKHSTRPESITIHQQSPSDICPYHSSDEKLFDYSEQ